MSTQVNLSTVGLEYPDEIRTHPIPLVMFWGDPQLTMSIFPSGNFVLDADHSLILTHKDSNFSCMRKPPKDPNELLRTEQQGVIRANWFHKHSKEIPSGMSI